MPLLIVLGVWTHLVRRVRATYTPQVWRAVFPLGMYTASTHQLARAIRLDVLLAVPRVMVHLAVLAWTPAFAGLLRRLGQDLVATERR